MEYSQTLFFVMTTRAKKCLNPYSNGILTDELLSIGQGYTFSS